MGCWNGTCELSKLPIICGDKMVTIMLISTGTQIEGLTYYSHDKFVPLGYPIFGEYNDYGCMENIENIEEQMNFLKTLKIFKEEVDQDIMENIYIPYEVSDFESFLKELMVGDTYFVVEYKNYYGQYKNINYITIHRKLYDDLINEMANRDTVSNDNKKYKEKIIDKIKDEFDKKRERQEKLKTLKEDDEEAAEYWFDNLTPLSKTLGFVDSINPHMTYDYLLDKLYENWDEKTLFYLTNIVLFDTVLSFMRSGYLVTSGLGSQNQEMYLQKILALFIFEYSNNYIEDYKKDNILDEDEKEEDLIKESIYMY